MDYFIYKTRKDGNYEREISHYKYITSASDTPELKTKEDFWKLVQYGHTRDKFYSWNVDRKTKVECIWWQIENGQPFLKSNPNSTEKDNLLELPDC